MPKPTDVTYLKSTRILTESDRDQLVKCYTRHKCLWKMELSETDLHSALSAICQYLGSDPRRVLIGCFRDGELQSILGMRFWTQFPFWTITHMRAFTNDDPQKFQASGLPACFSQALKLAENHMLYKFFFAWPCKPNSTNPFRQGAMQRMVPELRRYDSIVEAVIPPDTMPEFDWQKSLLANRTHPVPVVLTSGNLKPVYWRVPGFDTAKLQISLSLCLSACPDSEVGNI